VSNERRVVRILPDVIAHEAIKIQLALLCQHEEGRSGESLGDRAPVHRRIRSELDAGGYVRGAKAASVSLFGAAQDHRAVEPPACVEFLEKCIDTGPNSADVLTVQMGRCRDEKRDG
jgi:hypothetical protein